MLVSAVTGSERTLALGVDVVLEFVGMAVNKQFPHVDAYIVPWFDGNGPEAVRVIGQHVEGLRRFGK